MNIKKKYSMSRWLGKGIRYCKRMATGVAEQIRYAVLYPIARLKYRGRTVYLIAERGEDARDNGYHFFCFLREKHPEIEAYYVIRRTSPDYERVASVGRTVETGSLLHYLLFIGASHKISTHIMGYAPKVLWYAAFNQRHRVPGKQIFLQHGITQNDLSGLYAEHTRLDLFICGAEPEYRFVRDAFHYSGSEVVYTGLARYDALQNAAKRQLLVMPTWRVFNNLCTAVEFRETEYCRAWNRVLQDERLLAGLHRYGVELVFYPHYEVQRYLDCFTSADTAVHIADFAHYDVQALLKESSLLVTDYSSVFFDFAYMHKPCVYYQFDQEEFRGKHYAQGYFRYEDDGFGEVVTEHTVLVDTLLRYIQSEFVILPQYESRIDAFFPLCDTKNCERIFSRIEALP